jgi:hypothetical protein
LCIGPGAGVAFLALESGSYRREPIIPAAACPPAMPAVDDTSFAAAKSRVLSHPEMSW